jgi:hypothetical protein
MRSARHAQSALAACIAVAAFGPVACGARSGDDLPGYTELGSTGPQEDDASLDALDAGAGDSMGGWPDAGPESASAAGDAMSDATADEDGSSSADAPSTDAPKDVEVSCIGPCVPGDSKCEPAGLVSCTTDANGCNVWGTPVACGMNQVCQGTLIRAACVCRPGTVSMGEVCVPVIGVPRQVAPLSTATVTSQQPTLHWTLQPGTDGAQVDICTDRACHNLVTTFEAHGSSGSPGSPLSAGVYFWRIRGTSAGTTGMEVSPVWEFMVGARTAPVDTSWGSEPDVNGDGFSDVVIGTLKGGTGGIAVYDVYLGTAGGLSTTPVVVPGATTGYAMWGLSEITVASAGDTNGDGYPDIVVGLTGFNGYGATGAILVYLGGPDGMSTTPIQLAVQGVGYYGVSGPVTPASAGDVNGDGYADIVANAAYGTNLFFVFYGGPGGPTTTAQAIPLPGNPSTTVVSRLAPAGDVNGDGYGDFVVNSYLYLGGPGGPGSPVPNALGALACGEDVNGDGLSDLVSLGYVQYGTPAGLSTTLIKLTLPASAQNRNFLSSACAGDTNGDGFADVVLAVTDYSTPSVGYVFGGGPTGPSITPAMLAIPMGTSVDLGSASSGAGDINGDGFSDVLMADRMSEQLNVFLGGPSGFSSPAVLPSFNAGARSFQ